MSAYKQYQPTVSTAMNATRYLVAGTLAMMAAIAPAQARPATPSPELLATRPDRWTQQVREQLLRVARLIRTGGNRATHDPFIDELGNGGKDTISINLQKGIEYLIVGVCDEDCDDLDLVLRDDNGNIVSSDTKDNDVPIVRVTPRWNARFKVEVTMASCTHAPCRYGIGVFGNR